MCRVPQLWRRPFFCTTARSRRRLRRSSIPPQKPKAQPPLPIRGGHQAGTPGQVVEEREGGDIGMLPQMQVNKREHKVGRKMGETGKASDQLPQENAASGDVATFHGGITPFGSKDSASQSLIQSLQANDKKGKTKKNPLSPISRSCLEQAQNSCNMVVSMGPGPSSSTWLAPGSTDVWEVASPDSVPRGTVAEVEEFTEGVDSSSRTP